MSLLSLILTFFYLAAMGRALGACGLRNRTLEPGLVWLNLVPIFHLFWKFWTAGQTATSLRREFDARGLRTAFTFGRTVGTMVPTVALATRLIFWLVAFAGMRGGREVGLFMVFTTTLLGAVELTLMLVHWSQLSGYTRQLFESRPAVSDFVGGEEDGPREFDEDYRPYTRRRRRAE